MDQTVEAEFESLPAEVRAKTIDISNLIMEFGLPNIGLPYIKHIQDKIGTTQSSVARLESGNSLPSLRSLKK